MNQDLTRQLVNQVTAAAAHTTPLKIVGGGSKAWLGRETAGEALELKDHTGIVQYEPAELVVTVRAGTPLQELIETLAEENQMLGFEPPELSARTTIGGAIASGLSGPGRSYLGAAADFVLGMKILTGTGSVQNFGGRVIKNVAGFDVSRLMVGAAGCLGIILEVSLKVIPRPHCTVTMMRSASLADAIVDMNAMAGQPLPITAASWYDNTLRVRLAGSEDGVRSAAKEISGEAEEDNNYWSLIRDYAHPFLTQQKLFRASLKPATENLFGSRRQLVDWGGALRWLSNIDAAQMRDLTEKSGHGYWFCGGDRNGDIYPALPDAIMQIHRRLKSAFDPMRILNPGRLYKAL